MFTVVNSYVLCFQDKILQSGDKNETIQVTNDGATILKAIGVDNPAAKVLVGMCNLTFGMCATLRVIFLGYLIWYMSGSAV